MKFLVIVKDLCDSPAGGEKSLLTLMKGLSNSHLIKAIYISKYKKTFIEGGIEFHAVQGDIKVLKDFVLSLKTLVKFFTKAYSLTRAWNPDFIISQASLTPLAMVIARKLKVKSIIFLRSVEPICLICCRKFFIFPCVNRSCFSCAETLSEKLLYPYIQMKANLQRWAIKKASLVIANSKFVQEVFNRYMKIDSKIIYPIINFNEVVSKDEEERGFITFINPTTAKGLNIFIDIARKMPDKRFLVAGVVKDNVDLKRLRALENIAYLGFVDNIKRIYAMSRILLVPSIWPEPFGRVCVEAMANGIPCIASDVGGIKEAVGNAGVLIKDPTDIDLWIKAIEQFDDVTIYNSYVAKSKTFAKKFNLNKSIDRFLEVVKVISKQ